MNMTGTVIRNIAAEIPDKIVPLMNMTVIRAFRRLL